MTWRSWGIMLGVGAILLAVMVVGNLARGLGVFP